MKALKQTIFSIISIIDIIVLAKCIGYIVWGIQMPDSVADRSFHFMGAYLLAITYFVFFLVITLFLIICLIIYKKHKKKLNNI